MLFTGPTSRNKKERFLNIQISSYKLVLKYMWPKPQERCMWYMFWATAQRGKTMRYTPTNTTLWSFRTFSLQCNLIRSCYIIPFKKKLRPAALYRIQRYWMRSSSKVKKDFLSVPQFKNIFLFLIIKRKYIPGPEGRRYIFFICLISESSFTLSFDIHFKCEVLFIYVVNLGYEGHFTPPHYPQQPNLQLNFHDFMKT